MQTLFGRCNPRAVRVRKTESEARKGQRGTMRRLPVLVTALLRAVTRHSRSHGRYLLSMRDFLQKICKDKLYLSIIHGREKGGRICPSCPFLPPLGGARGSQGPCGAVWPPTACHSEEQLPKDKGQHRGHGGRAGPGLQLGSSCWVLPRVAAGPEGGSAFRKEDVV